MIKKLNVPISFDVAEDNLPGDEKFENIKDAIVAWDNATRSWKTTKGTEFNCRISSVPMQAEAIMRIGIDDFEEILGLDGE